jgi:hypothetical protein
MMRRSEMLSGKGAGGVSASAREFASSENPAAPIALVFKKFRRFNLEFFINLKEF